MARSLWKGRSFIKNFIAPAYQINKVEAIKLLKPLNAENSTTCYPLEELKIYRRNHVLLNSQIPFIKTFFTPYQLYNGYDFIKKMLPTNNSSIDGNFINFNLAGTVFTREMNVTHKIKLSKAARKNNAKLKKRTSVLTKTTIKTTLVKKKASLSKKIK